MSWEETATSNNTCSLPYKFMDGTKKLSYLFVIYQSQHFFNLDPSVLYIFFKLNYFWHSADGFSWDWYSMATWHAKHLKFYWGFETFQHLSSPPVLSQWPSIKNSIWKWGVLRGLQPWSSSLKIFCDAQSSIFESRSMLDLSKYSSPRRKKVLTELPFKGPFDPGIKYFT